MEKYNKGICGFQNLKYTCYLNSALQCLLNTDFLNDYFINNNFDNKYLVNEYKKLLVVVKEENCIISPISLVKYLNKLFISKKIDFNVYRQNDVQEFLILFLDNLHEELKRKVNITISGNVITNKDKLALKAMKSWKNNFEKNYSKIIDLFFGQIINIIEVEDEVKSVSFSPMSFFTLPISKDENENIYDCFDNFCKTHYLTDDNQWKCDKTNKYYDATQKIKIWKLPKVLIINFKRFDIFQKKINNYIDFPKILNLEKYTLKYYKENNYELYGIINHIGNLNNGHYYCYCKKGEKWYNLDDSSISQINEKSIFTKNAYILFYKLKN